MNGFIKSKDSFRFNEEFWNVGSAYTLELDGEEKDAILVRETADAFGITTLVFVSATTYGSTKEFPILVWDWVENNNKCVRKMYSGTYPTEPIKSVITREFNPQAFADVSASYFPRGPKPIIGRLLRVKLSKTEDLEPCVVIGFAESAIYADQFYMYIGSEKIIIDIEDVVEIESLDYLLKGDEP